MGSMGENDGGVWFLADERCKQDTLDWWELLKGLIESVKISRHGVPCTCGRTLSVFDACELLAQKFETDLGLSSVEVTLSTGDAGSYRSLIGSDDEAEARIAFNTTFSFISTAAESELPVTVSVKGGRYAGAASDLAKSLGAVQVRVYP